MPLYFSLYRNFIVSLWIFTLRVPVETTRSSAITQRPAWRSLSVEMLFYCCTNNMQTDTCCMCMSVLYHEEYDFNNDDGLDWWGRNCNVHVCSACLVADAAVLSVSCCRFSSYCRLRLLTAVVHCCSWMTWLTRRTLSLKPFADCVTAFSNCLSTTTAKIRFCCLCNVVVM